MRSRLRCVKGCAAMAAPRHVSPIAGTPHGTDRPAAVAVGVAVGQHVGGTTTQPRSVGTRSPTKLFGKSSRRGLATAMLYPRLPTKSPPLCGYLMQGVGAQLVLRCVYNASHIHHREMHPGQDLVGRLAGVQRIAHVELGVQRFRLCSGEGAVIGQISEVTVRVGVGWRGGDLESLFSQRLSFVSAGSKLDPRTDDKIRIGLWTSTKPSSLAAAPAATKRSESLGTRPPAGNREPAQDARPGRPTPQPARATPAGRCARPGNA
jgi:hypothetical protein